MPERLSDDVVDGAYLRERAEIVAADAGLVDPIVVSWHEVSGVPRPPRGYRSIRRR
jgi:hypothetical protein